MLSYEAETKRLNRKSRHFGEKETGNCHPHSLSRLMGYESFHHMELLCPDL